jgi:hypothetical protein
MGGECHKVEWLKVWALSSSPSTAKKKKKEKYESQEPVAHTCHPSYSGGRDQEDHGSKPAWANSSRDPISKNTHYKGLANGLSD